MTQVPRTENPSRKTTAKKPRALLIREEWQVGPVEVEMRRGIPPLLGLADGVLSSFPETRELMKKLVKLSQVESLELSPVATAIQHWFGPKSVFGGNPTYQLHIRNICTILTLLERIADEPDAPTTPTE